MMYKTLVEKIILIISVVLVNKINIVFSQEIPFKKKVSEQDAIWFLYMNNYDQSHSVIQEIEHIVHKLNDTFFVSKFEVYNKLYHYYLLEYKFSGDTVSYNRWRLNFNEQNHKNKIALPAYSICKNKEIDLIQNYYLHPFFSFYPTINISKSDAINFCEWLTKKLNNLNDNKTYIIRLPTEKEFNLFSDIDNIKKSKHKKYTQRRCNCNLNFCDSTIYEKVKENKKKYKYAYENWSIPINFLEEVYAFKPNKYGLYNIFGNVSEMVQEDGFVKGGDWYHDTTYCHSDARLPWDGTPQPYIGFRFVVIIKKNP